MIIPTELIMLCQWTCWRLEHGTKIPYNPATGRRASCSDPLSWVEYREAVNAQYRFGYSGVQFALTADDPYTVLDIDDAFNENGILNPFAGEIIRKLNSFTEISFSGRGVHIFVRGRLPEGRRRNKQIEMYSDKRLIAVTGNHLAGTPKNIENRQAELTALHGELFPPSVPWPVRRAVPVSLNDRELLERSRNSRNGARFMALWSGETGGDWSAADLVLCNMLAFATGYDAARIDALFRQSGLMREKWDRRWRDSTYGRMTIAKAVGRT